MGSYQTALQTETYIHGLDDETADAPFRAERTDSQLVDLVLAGDGGAFEQIFDRYKRLVAAIANRYFRRPEEIEEIIQISFAKAFAELGKFRGEYDRSMSSWLARITANACFDTLRKMRRKPERLNCDLSEHEIESLLESTAEGPQSVEKSVLDRDLAEKLLSRVAADDRALLQMLYSEEMSVEEIAAFFGWSRSKVKIRAWRARIALRGVLRKYL